MGRISWAAFYTWIGVWAVATTIILDEELGILHKFGLNPITIDALRDPRLFIAIGLAGPVYTAWWLVHIYRRKYGDLALKEDVKKYPNPASRN